MTLQAIAMTLRTTPTVLRTLLSHVDDATLSHRADGDWCIKEVIGHLIEGDKGAFRERIAEIIGGIEEITPVSPTAPLKARKDRESSLEQLLEELEGERAVSAEFITGLNSADLSKSAHFPKYGQFTAGDFVYEWPYHDHDHVQQILTILKGTYLPMMSDTMRTALSD